MVHKLRPKYPIGKFLGPDYGLLTESTDFRLQQKLRVSSTLDICTEPRFFNDKCCHTSWKASAR